MYTNNSLYFILSNFFVHRMGLRLVYNLKPKLFLLFVIFVDFIIIWYISFWVLTNFHLINYLFIYFLFISLFSLKSLPIPTTMPHLFSNLRLISFFSFLPTTSLLSMHALITKYTNLPLKNSPPRASTMSTLPSLVLVAASENCLAR